MSDWLDDFQMMGTKLNEGEKSLMRFAMKKEQQRIIDLLPKDLRFWVGNRAYDKLIALIKNSGDQK